MNESIASGTIQVGAWRNRLRLAAAGVISGAAFGLITGLLSRGTMRVTALLAHASTGFSWAMTLGIALVYVVLFGLPSGLLTPLLVRDLSRRRWTQSLLCGAATFVVFGIPFLIVGPNGLKGAEPKWLNYLMYGSHFVFLGMANAWGYAWLESRLPVATVGRRGLAVGYGVLAFLGVACLVLMVAISVMGA